MNNVGGSSKTLVETKLNTADMGKADLTNRPIEGSFLLGGMSTSKVDWDFKDLSLFFSREAPEWLAEMRDSKAGGDNRVQEDQISND